MTKTDTNGLNRHKYVVLFSIDCYSESIIFVKH